MPGQFVGSMIGASFGLVYVVVNSGEACTGSGLPTDVPSRA